MKAIVMRKSGMGEELRLEYVPMPEIDDSQILVRINVTSVNHIDWKKGSGKMGPAATPEFPWTPGADFSGVVAKVGQSVSGFEEGDEVVGCSDGGTYAEYIAADPAKTVKKPHRVTSMNAVAASFVGVTALQALFRHGELAKGQSVLIHGSAGAVGAYAVQLASNAEAHVYATAAKRDMKFVLSMGANAVIDYESEDFTRLASGMDLVIDLIGGDTLDKSYGVLKPGGTLVTLVGEVNEALASAHKVNALRMGVKPNAEDLGKIMHYLDYNELKTDIAAVFWLRDAGKAWNYVLNGNLSERKHGKIIIQVR